MVDPTDLPWKAYAKQSFKNVSASSVCASESAHNLRYDAVFDTVPSTNSIVSII